MDFEMRFFGPIVKQVKWDHSRRSEVASVHRWLADSNVRIDVTPETGTRSWAVENGHCATGHLDRPPVATRSALVVIENKINACESTGQLGWYERKLRHWRKHQRSGDFTPHLSRSINTRSSRPILVNGRSSRMSSWRQPCETSGMKTPRLQVANGSVCISLPSYADCWGSIFRVPRGRTETNPDISRRQTDDQSHKHPCNFPRGRIYRKNVSEADAIRDGDFPVAKASRGSRRRSIPAPTIMWRHTSVLEQEVQTRREWRLSRQMGESANRRRKWWSNYGDIRKPPGE